MSLSFYFPSHWDSFKKSNLNLRKCEIRSRLGWSSWAYFLPYTPRWAIFLISSGNISPKSCPRDLSISSPCFCAVCCSNRKLFGKMGKNVMPLNIRVYELRFFFRWFGNIRLHIFGTRRKYWKFWYQYTFLDAISCRLTATILTCYFWQAIQCKVFDEE